MEAVATKITVFRVIYDAGISGYDEELAMLELFSACPEEGVVLQEESKVRYFSGNYDEDGRTKFWIGELNRVKERQTVDVTKDSKGNLLIRRHRGGSGNGSEGWTRYAYVPRRHLLFVWETSNVPYTRFPSYVKAVTRVKAPQYSLTLKVVPDQKKIRSAVAQFDTIDKFKAKFRHSQSPGNRFNDEYTKEFNAEWVETTIQAPENGSLNKERLLDPKHVEGATIIHIDRNGRNGIVRVEGLQDGIRHVWDSARRVLSWILPIQPTAKEFAREVQALLYEVPETDPHVEQGPGIEDPEEEAQEFEGRRVRESEK